jgi:pimeloyl-ACP methyl ester carboxylesterase
MLLFQFVGLAERWLSGDDFRNLREWSGHPDIEPVIKRLTDAAALTASLSLYRAILTPESLVEEGMTGSARYVTGPWRYERVDGAGHWLPLDAPGKVNALLLDFLGQQGEIR